MATGSRRIGRHGKLSWLTGPVMPLDPLAKRFLAMMAAASSGARTRPTASERRQSLAKLMRFARSDAAGVTATDGVLPGPAGDIPYRLYSPATDPTALPTFLFFHVHRLLAATT